MSPPVQWAIFITLAAVIFGSHWALQEIEQVSKPRRRIIPRMFASFDFTDWAVFILGVTFFIPLVAETVVALR